MKCSEEDIYTIAEYDFDWRRVGRRLLHDQKVTDIDHEGGSEGEKREKMLLEWKRTKSRDATYQALVKALRAIRNNATADRVEDLERKHKSGNKMYYVHNFICNVFSCQKCNINREIIAVYVTMETDRVHYTYMYCFIATVLHV